MVERKSLRNVAGMFHVAMSADGRLGVAAQLRPKNLIPLAHVEHGWVFGDSLTLFGEDVGGTVQIPIDELDRYYALPWGVAIAPDKSKIFLTTAGSQSVTVLDVPNMLKTVRTRHQPFVNDLSASADYVEARITVGHNPRGLVLSPDGKRLYVANRLDDTISVIDTSADKVSIHVRSRRTKECGRSPSRRAPFLHCGLCIPGAIRLLQLPSRCHDRRPAMGSGAGWFRKRHC